jgi:hypothetical protein
VKEKAELVLSPFVEAIQVSLQLTDCRIALYLPLLIIDVTILDYVQNLVMFVMPTLQHLDAVTGENTTDDKQLNE